MNEDFELIPNPGFDPAKPFGENGNFPDMVDPLCRAARSFCENVWLPMLEEDHAAGSRTALGDALVLIATHQVAPPPWLASAMLKEFRKKPRENAVTAEKVRAIWLFVQKEKAKSKVSLDDLARRIGLSESTLDRLLKRYRDDEERRGSFVDKMPD